MNKRFVFTFIFFVFSLSFVDGLKAQTNEEIRKGFTSFLYEQELFSKIDDDGDVQFKYDGKTFFLDVNENDPEFFRMVLANIWSIDSEEERTRAYKVVNGINAEKKVGKIYLTNDNVWVAIETFLDEPEDYKAYFDRSLKIMLECVNEFVEGM